MKRTVGLFVLSPTSRLVRKATGHYRLTCRLPSARNVPLEKELLIPLQEKEKLVYTCGQLFLIMCHHNHGLVLTTTESSITSFTNRRLYKSNPMQRLVQNKQLRILHKSTGQQHQTLLATGQLQEIPVFQICNTKISIHHSQAAICSGRGRGTTPQESCSPLATISMAGRFFR